MSLDKSRSLYVIPHYCVKMVSSTTIKLRVVFNASDRDSSGLPLNDRLLSDFKLEKNIVDILSHQSNRFVL